MSAPEGYVYVAFTGGSLEGERRLFPEPARRGDRYETIATGEVWRFNGETFINAEAWEAGYAERSRMTVEQLRSHGRVVRECPCAEEDCDGWQSVNLIDYEFDQRMRARSRPR